MAHARTRRRTVPVLALAGLACALGACYSEGGRMFSEDRFTYVSTEWYPKTLSLTDTRTGELLWSVDVPVGKQLTVGFTEGIGPNEYKPDMMQWGIVPAGRIGATMRNRMPVPAAASRRLELSLRSGPELPGDELPESPFDPEVQGYQTIETSLPEQTPPEPSGAAPAEPEPGEPADEEFDWDWSESDAPAAGAREN